MESILPSRAVIVCDHNGKFEFSNTTTVNVTGLDFVRCFENHVISVGNFEMEHSRFYGEAQLVNGIVLTIDESTATLDRVAFISTVQVSIQNDAANLNLSDSYPDSATVVLSRKSIIVISQSWFEGNSVGLGRVIENFDSDITILNTTFADNSAATRCSTGVLVHSSSSQGNYVKIYDSNFEQNVGAMILTLTNNMYISCSKFINNSAPNVMARVD